MKTASYQNFLREVKVLKSFYHATLDSYALTSSLLNFRGKNKVEFKNLRNHEDFEWIQSDHFRRKRKFERRTNKVLTELILIRTISALEVYLIDLIKDVFLVTKAPFKDKSVTHEFSQEELIALNNPAKIFNRIISKETRKLSNGGFSEIIKYYKKRFDIDIGSITPGISIMREYHDRRHILVHRLGNTDTKYRRDYETEERKISVSQEYIDTLLLDVEQFAEKLHHEIFKLISSVTVSDKKTERSRYIVDVSFLGDSIPSCLQADFQFWSDDELVVLSDILKDSDVLQDKGIRYYFSGNPRSIYFLKRHLRNEKKKGTIRLQNISDVSTGKPSDLPEQVIDEIERRLPAQPWPKGIHKQIATAMELSNTKVSSAINLLIARGVYKDQFDGELKS
ncbi:hypothetical protein [Cerasicoccus fimbriatus]|uniref:hypothetical protein n=1 Tax=Cerasicoccus fimbriatus TaxID=3014554 RepID=UPI0022B5BBED|nr:hypothetical protein [Cerasicoccus sp. TK19100]